jgi:hypothetical protein
MSQSVHHGGPPGKRSAATAPHPRIRAGTRVRFGRRQVCRDLPVVSYRQADPTTGSVGNLATMDPPSAVSRPAKVLGSRQREREAVCARNRLLRRRRSAGIRAIASYRARMDPGCEHRRRSIAMDERIRQAPRRSLRARTGHVRAITRRYLARRRPCERFPCLFRQALHGRVGTPYSKP